MMQHLALIMDGNRRWAKQRSMFPWLGHRQGVHTVEMVLKYCLDNKIPYVSLYTLSLENLSRSEQELLVLFSLLQDAQKRAQEFVEKGIQVRFVGDLSALPEVTAQACLTLQKETQHCTALVCNLLVCYGGQQEIVAAAQKLIDQDETTVTKKSLQAALWTGDIPAPDLIIRTGGVQRLSNFLLFQGAYAEIRFLDCFWPDLTLPLLDSVVKQAVDATKNFGR